MSTKFSSFVNPIFICSKTILSSSLDHIVKNAGDVSAVVLDSVFSFLIAETSFDESLLLRFLLASATLVCFGSLGFLANRSGSSRSSDSINRFSRLAVRIALESSAVILAPCGVFLLLVGDRLVDFFELGDLR